MAGASNSFVEIIINRYFANAICWNCVSYFVSILIWIYVLSVFVLVDLLFLIIWNGKDDFIYLVLYGILEISTFDNLVMHFTAKSHKWMVKYDIPKTLPLVKLYPEHEVCMYFVNWSCTDIYQKQFPMLF